MFVTQPLRGIILCGSRLASDVLLAIIAHNNLPMVIINRTLHHPNVACVRTDMEGGTWRATRHLLDLNHTRIAFLSGPIKSEQSLARRRGVEKALAEAGLTLPPELCPASFPNVDGGFQAMSALLALPPAQRPTACDCYRMGRLAMQTLRRMLQGHPPPEESFTLMKSPFIVRESTAPAPTTNEVHP